MIGTLSEWQKLLLLAYYCSQFIYSAGAGGRRKTAVEEVTDDKTSDDEENGLSLKAVVQQMNGVLNPQNDADRSVYGSFSSLQDSLLDPQEILSTVHARYISM